jgi:hypothetical protein
MQREIGINDNEVDVQHLYPCLIIKFKVISTPKSKQRGRGNYQPGGSYRLSILVISVIPSTNMYINQHV